MDNLTSLVIQAQSGDKDALGLLFTRYWRMARAAAYSACTDLHLAEDAAAEAFRIALTTLGQLREPDRFPGWLRTIAIRCARQAARARHAFEPCLSPAPAPGEELEQLELARALQAAIYSLSPLLRETVFLFYFEGYSLEECAALLGIPVGTAKRRLHDARQKLRERSGLPLPPADEQLEGATDDASFRALQQALRQRVPSDRLAKALQKYAGKTPPAGLAAMQPSPESLDPAHPLGRVAARLRAAWPGARDRAPGTSLSPGQFVTATRALVFPGADSFRLLRDGMVDCNGLQDFARSLHSAALLDVLDFYWEESEMRALETRVLAVLQELRADPELHAELHWEPRYRSAFRIVEGSVPLASGGILLPAGCYPGGAHARFYLPACAWLASGEPMQFASLASEAARYLPHARSPK